MLALGTQTLFVLSSSGVLKAMKLLDFRPTAFCVYPRPRLASSTTLSLVSETNTKDCGGIIIGSDDARLLIFSSSTNLLWVACGAQGNSQALAISTIDVPNSSVFLSPDDAIPRIPDMGSAPNHMIVASSRCYFISRVQNVA